MSDLELSKNNILSQLKRMCAHCNSDKKHYCPIQSIAAQIKSIRGVPLIVNNEFAGLLWNKAI